MKQKMCIEVRGREKSWSFVTYADPRYLLEWESDNLQIFILENSIPTWVVDWFGTPGIKVWCWVEDAWRFLRVW